MRRDLLPTEVHAAFDVAVGVLLIAAPWIFEFEDVGRIRGVFVGAGAALLALALMTRYELGLLPVIPMELHLLADALLGVFLVCCAIGAATNDALGRVWAAFLVLGLAELVLAFVTSVEPSVPSYRRRLVPSET